MADATKAKRRRVRRDHEIVPPTTTVLMSREQICTALGVCERTFDGMVASEKYPKADCRIGPLPRWKVETHNAWVAEACGAAKGA